MFNFYKNKRNVLVHSMLLVACVALSSAPQNLCAWEWKNSKMNPKTWFKKKEFTPEQVEKRRLKYIKAVNKLTAEIERFQLAIKERQAALDRVDQRSENLNKYITGTGLSAEEEQKLRATLAITEDRSAMRAKLYKAQDQWSFLEKELDGTYKNLVQHRKSLGDESSMNEDSGRVYVSANAKTIKADLEKADKAIRKTKGTIKSARDAVAGWLSKAPGFRKSKKEAPILLEALALDPAVSTKLTKDRLAQGSNVEETTDQSTIAALDLEPTKNKTPSKSIEEMKHDYERKQLTEEQENRTGEQEHPIKNDNDDADPDWERVDYGSQSWEERKKNQ